MLTSAYSIDQARQRGRSTLFEVATTEHIHASSSAIREVANEINVEDDTVLGGLHVRLCHFQHDAFLNPILHGFTALALHAERASLPTIPVTGELTDVELLALADGRASLEDIRNIQLRESAQIVDPKAATPATPLRLMVSINNSVDTQIATTLSGVSTLLGRQAMVAGGAADLYLPLLPDRAEALDTTARAEVADKTRAFGWHSVAAQLRERSIAQRTPIRIDYHSPTFTASEVAARVPLMRHVYNIFPEVRAAVDKVVALTARSMHVAGDAPVELLRHAEDLMERASVKAYHAHLIRDVFVCGNGVISFGENPSVDIRLLPPESLLQSRGVNEVQVSEGSQAVWLDRALHLRGSDQIDSEIGVSYLEPFLQIAMERYMWLEAMLISRSWAASSATPRTPHIQQHIRTTEGLAVRGLTKVRHDLEQVLGTLTAEYAAAPADLYFPGHELMQPSVNRVSIYGGDESK